MQKLTLILATCWSLQGAQNQPFTSTDFAAFLNDRIRNPHVSKKRINHILDKDELSKENIEYLFGPLKYAIGDQAKGYKLSSTVKINPTDNHKLLVCFQHKYDNKKKIIATFDQSTLDTFFTELCEPIRNFFYEADGAVKIKYTNSPDKGKTNPAFTPFYPKIKCSPDTKSLLSYDNYAIHQYKAPYTGSSEIVGTIQNPLQGPCIEKIKYSPDGSEFVVYSKQNYATFDANTLSKLNEGTFDSEKNHLMLYTWDNQLLSLYYDKPQITFKDLSAEDHDILKDIRTYCERYACRMHVDNLDLFKKIYAMDPLLLTNDNIVVFKKNILKSFMDSQLPMIIPTYANFFTNLQKKSLTFLLLATRYWKENWLCPVDHTQCDLLIANHAPLTVLKKLFDTQLLDPFLDLHADKITNGAYLGSWAKQPIINTLYGKNNNGLLFLIMAYQRSWKYRKPHVVANEDAEIFFNLRQNITQEPFLQKLYSDPHFFDVSTISDESCKVYIKKFISKKMPSSLMKAQIMSSSVIKTVPVASFKQALLNT